MTHSSIVRAGVVMALALVLLPTPGTAQLRRLAPAPATFTPKFEAVAETKLLMEGLIHSNYRSLKKLLKTKPADRDTWVFARGQAILVAESGNLLLLRPPRGTGRDPWMKLAMEMRSEATTLARAAATKNYPGSVKGLADLATSCKNCHSTFRVNVKIDPEPAGTEGDAE